jgi:hypothetical protein
MFHHNNDNEEEVVYRSVGCFDTVADDVEDGSLEDGFQFFKLGGVFDAPSRQRQSKQLDDGFTSQPSKQLETHFSLEEEIVEAEPKEAPSYIEKNYCLRSALPAHELRSLLSAWLVEQHIDFTSKKWKLNAVAYNAGESTSLTIRFYKQGVDTVVEIQKVAGSSEGRVRTFKQVCAMLGARASTLDGRTVNSELRSFGTLPMPDFEPAPVSYKHLVSTLVSMADSEFLDLQQQASAELANIACSNAPAFAHSDIFSTVLKLLDSGNDETIRCALLVLAHTVHADGALKVDGVSPLLTRLFGLLGLPGGSMVTLESKRLVCRILATLASTQAALLLTCVSAITANLCILQRFQHTDDSKLRENVLQATAGLASLVC